ncbi:MAG: hypothetical protein FRX49_02708 [Trebouxia sp. A1-2]|nr:MAG: hypothetical protein FRX49_02708 [Trebouxia sp. A1-2]
MSVDILGMHTTLNSTKNSKYSSQASYLHTAQQEPMEVETVAVGATLCLRTWPFSEEVGNCLENRVWLGGLHWGPDLDTAIQSTAQQVALQTQNRPHDTLMPDLQAGAKFSGNLKNNRGPRPAALPLPLPLPARSIQDRSFIPLSTATDFGLLSAAMGSRTTSASPSLPATCPWPISLIAVA